MRKNNQLTEDDLHLLLKTKLKEPGIEIDELYVNISRIHPKPRIPFYIIVLVWVASLVLFSTLTSSVWCQFFFLIHIVSAIIVIALQKAHQVSPIPWYLIAGIAAVVLILFEDRIKEVGVPKDAVENVKALFSGKPSIS